MARPKKEIDSKKKKTKRKYKKKKVVEPKKEIAEEKKEEEEKPKRSVWQSKVVQFFTAIFGVGVITFCTPMFDVVDDATGGFLTTIWDGVADAEDKFEEVNDDINNNDPFNQDENKDDWKHSEKMAYPMVNDKSPMFIRHKNYALLYNEKHEQAEWVAYQLKSSEIKGTNRRHNNFKADSKIITKSAKASDYKGSGYDRGHLAPASDFKFSSLAMTESFYMSNMSPQAPAFNRGIWKGLEDLVRRWAEREEILYIATGPVLKPRLRKIGTSTRISIPKQFYKIILKLDKDRPKMIAFLMPNKLCEGFYEEYVVSTDKIEQLTGIDFFANLPDELEKKLESNLNSTYWFDQPEAIPSPEGNLRILE